MNRLLNLFKPNLSGKQIYYPELDIFRSLAIILVVFFHATLLYFDYYVTNIWIHLRNPLLSFWYEGHTGVDLLFVLSGFLLYRSGRKVYLSKKSLVKYYLKRALRIIPVYYASVLLGLLTVTKPDISFASFFPYLIFLTNLPMVFAYLSPFNAVYWAIDVEVHFSVLFPFIKNLLSSYLTLIFLILISLLTKLLLSDNITYISSIYGRLDQFLIGIILAKICFETRLPEVLAKKPNLTQAAIVFIMFVLWFVLWWLNLHGGYVIMGLTQAVYHPLLALIWAILILLVFSVNNPNHLTIEQFNLAKQDLAPRDNFSISQFNNLSIPSLFYSIVSFISAISYSMFVWHFPIMALIIKWQKENGLIVNETSMVLNTLLIIIPAVFVISSLSYLLIERPFLERKRLFQ